MEPTAAPGSGRQMGNFILEMRKARGLTQKELAKALGVTDKAVSKWERGASCPDISLLLPLAGLLDVSAEELLNGRRACDVPEESPAAQPLLAKSRSRTFWFLEDSPESHQMKLGLFLGVSALFLLSLMTCLICDYFSSQSFTWSLPVLASLVLAWTLLLPFLAAWKRPLLKALSLLSVFLIPYLALLSLLLKAPLLLRLGFYIAVISLAGLWCIYGAFSRYYGRKYRAFGMFFLIAAFLSFVISLTVTHFTGENKNGQSLVLKIILSLALSALCFLLDYYKIQARNHMA